MAPKYTHEQFTQFKCRECGEPFIAEVHGGRTTNFVLHGLVEVHIDPKTKFHYHGYDNPPRYCYAKALAKGLP